MKNDTGVKEGDKMSDSKKSGKSSKSLKSDQDKNGTLTGTDTHSTHDKRMKNDTGVKEGETMENPH